MPEQPAIPTAANEKAIARPRAPVCIAASYGLAPVSRYVGRTRARAHLAPPVHLVGPPVLGRIMARFGSRDYPLPA